MNYYNPFFSIITPFYNAERFVLKYIKQLKKQTFKNWECILIDDYSDDKSYKKIQQLSRNDKRIKIFKNKFKKEIKGPYQARNYGLKKANGEYICFLDIDDFWYKNMLSVKSAIDIIENKLAES